MTTPDETSVSTKARDAVPSDRASGTVALTVNASFLQEIKEVHTELWDTLIDLHCLCSRPLSLGLQCRGLVNRLRVIRELLALQFSLEDGYGYFREPNSADAVIASHAEALRREHRTLLSRMDQLVDQAQRWHDGHRLAELTTAIPRRFSEFFHQLRAHETAEIELIQEVWLRDAGLDAGLDGSLVDPTSK